MQREDTVIFTDLRGFTTFAGWLALEQGIEVLSRYMSEIATRSSTTAIRWSPT